MTYLEELILPLFIIILITTAILGTWIFGVRQALKLPNGRKILKSFMSNTLMIGGVLGLLLGSYMSSTSIGAFASLGIVLGLVVGVITTFVLAGFVLAFKMKKALSLYQQNNENAPSFTNSDILDN